jgi:hypothetical protein
MTIERAPTMTIERARLAGRNRTLVGQARA